MKPILKTTESSQIRFEKRVAESLRPIFPKARRRRRDPGSPESAHEYVSLGMTATYRFICKKTKQYYAPISTIRKIRIRAYQEGYIPVLVTEGGIREPAMVTLPLEYFVDMLTFMYQGGRHEHKA